MRLKLITLKKTFISRKDKKGKIIIKSIKFNQSEEHIRPSTSNAVWTREKSLTRQIDESVRMSFKPLSKR